jgi:hypothetical protein
MIKVKDSDIIRNMKTGLIQNLQINFFSCIPILVLLFLLGYLSLPHPWLIDRLSTTPFFLVLLFSLLLILMLVSKTFIENAFFYYEKYLSEFLFGCKQKPWLYCSIVFALSLLIFSAFRIQRVDSGDILQITIAAKQGTAFLVEHAPLETLVRCWIAEFVVHYTNWNLEETYKWYNILIGCIVIVTILRVSSSVKKPYNYLIASFLLLSPAMNIYCGYLEVYGVSNLFQIVFLLLAFRFIEAKSSLYSISVAFGFSLAVGFWNGIFIFACIYLFWIQWKRDGISITDWILHGLLVGIPIAASLALLSPFANPFAGIITRLSEPSVLIPFSPYAAATGYGVFSTKHIADWSNEILLVFLLPFTIMTLFLLYHPKQFFMSMKCPLFWFYFLAAVPAFVFGFFYYPILGFPVDWDLYTFIYPSLSMCGVIIMKNKVHSFVWRKWFIILVLLTVGISSAWILENALFWRYPSLIHTIGPYVSPIVPDFYYKKMQQAHKQNNEANLYVLADLALQESPERYKEILELMDAWTVTTVSHLPPRPYDYPGWACDLVRMKNSDNQVLVFDVLGRIFRYEKKQLTWIFAPSKQIPSPVVAGDLLSDDSAVFLCENGQLYKIPISILTQETQSYPIWETPQEIAHFIPEAPTRRNIPIQMVDLSIQRGNDKICVLDNFNRVWDIETKKMMLQGFPSNNLTQSLHLTFQNQPVTIDVNNQLSYPKETVTLPFDTTWFHPIVRDFLFTPDEQGIMILDLNGNIHYYGSTPIYKDVVTPGEIVDRYKKMIHLPQDQSILLLDNRYRLKKAGLDPKGATARQKIGNMIAGGNISTAYKILNVLWNQSSQYTHVCYDILNTEILREMPGMMMYNRNDGIKMIVDVFPLDEDLIVCIDRWGRLIYINQGVLFLLEGSGLVSWPRTEAINGTVGINQIMFLCKDGSIWQYPYPRFFRESDPEFKRVPRKWLDLNSQIDGHHWIGIETSSDKTEIAALSSKGLLIRIDMMTKHIVETIQIPTKETHIFDFDYIKEGLQINVAFSSKEGPAWIYNHETREIKALENTHFGWPAVNDILFSRSGSVILLDLYGVIHQYPPVLQFAEKPYTIFEDAVCLRFLKKYERVLWVRGNGFMNTIKVTQ